MFGLGMAQSLLAFIFVFGMLVFFHELGHYTAARLSGIRVIEFSLGMGRLIGSIKRGQTIYSLRWVPLGGFVKLAGMDDGDVEDGIRQDEFRSRPLLLRIFTIISGPLMNLVLAVLLFAGVFAVIGVPNVTIAEVFEGSPASEAGLIKGDKIVAVEGNSIDSVDTVIEAIGRSARQPVDLTVLRGNEKIKLRVTPLFDESAKAGRIGVSLGQSADRVSPIAACGRGIRYTANISKSIVTSLADMVTGRAKAEVTGPIGIMGVVGTTAKAGFLSLIFLLAILSINLAIVNLLPIPVLDGGWVIFILIEAIRGRPLKPEQKGMAQFVGLAVLMFLFLFASYADLNRLNIFERIRDAVQGWFS